ncbi:oxidoreductase family, NAD-binding Rossmann fold family protein [Asticcacaulis biprosthecium C19]|uniref:Oxidoreductase family, NAD-binding Rossmann fold family protein n=1 Tax=Asticcacaulis biprosthecium C19 TaxID=715226 RepID=F4QPS8_9CAUL|nr:Gfo/Idh/MocA family oxidoreductase [Asticcacaulis biprosthecium]EGF90215.1 oxidoreductase family, NAD-binding Rossmann fold family protein [Asticcacaulis biprosthecium C19]
MTRVLRAGVAGAGVFGGYHANKYKQASDIDFVGIYDLDIERAQTAATAHGVAAFDDLDAFLSSIDVLTIATPAFAHAAVALAALEKGIHVYTEKPLAVTSRDGEAMVAMAAEKGLVLACGHQERAVFEAMGLYDVPEKPLRLEAVRNGTASTRNLDVSVVLDLMIHDLDLAISLAGCEAGGLQATGRRREDEGYSAVGGDEVNAEVDFENGMKAVFRASRMAAERERTMRIVYPSGTVFIDLLNRKFENGTPFALNSDFAEADIARDPLGTSVFRFLDTVLGVRDRPLCTGAEALQALELGFAIDEDVAF